jgi:hypothetical protein
VAVDLRGLAAAGDDLQWKEIAAIVGDQEMGAALNSRRDDWPVLEIAWNLLQIPEVTGHELAHLSQSTDDGAYSEHRHFKRHFSFSKIASAKTADNRSCVNYINLHAQGIPIPKETGSPFRRRTFHSDRSFR